LLDLDVEAKCAIINQAFVNFDSFLAGRGGVEKIKTISSKVLILISTPPDGIYNTAADVSNMVESLYNDQQSKPIEAHFHGGKVICIRQDIRVGVAYGPVIAGTKSLT
jgi:hypothetical protein